MTDQEKLDILNSMEIIDEDFSSGELVYLLVEYSEENIEKLSKVVPDINEYLKTSGDINGTKEDICIATAAFEYANADYFYKGKFVIFTKEELMELYEKEQSKRKRAESELKNFKSQIRLIRNNFDELLKALDSVTT